MEYRTCFQVIEWIQWAAAVGLDPASETILDLTKEAKTLKTSMLGGVKRIGEEKGWKRFQKTQYLCSVRGRTWLHSWHPWSCKVSGLRCAPCLECAPLLFRSFWSTFIIENVEDYRSIRYHTIRIDWINPRWNPGKPHCTNQIQPPLNAWKNRTGHLHPKQARGSQDYC